MTPGMPDLAAVADLVAVMDRLRSPGGCPWDAEQTHTSLLPFAVEEVFEVVEAVEEGDRAALREELGDLLLQVVFHARIAAEHPTEPFTLDDVAAGIAAKLRRRHPHVFAGAQVRDAEHVSTRWDEIKRAEKERGSALDGVPAGLPALARAQALLDRARRAGLTTPVPDDVVGTHGIDGSDGAGDAGGSSGTASVEPAAIGSELLSVVLRAQAAGVDAEAALRAAVRGLEADLRSQEARPEV
jgi:XTP/dITP diphosphohydrolase